MLGAMFGNCHATTLAPLFGDLLSGCSLSVDFPEQLLAPLKEDTCHIDCLPCILQRLCEHIESSEGCVAWTSDFLFVVYHACSCFLIFVLCCAVRLFMDKIATYVYGSELAHHQCCNCGVVSLLAILLVPARFVCPCLSCSWIVALLQRGASSRQCAKDWICILDLGWWGQTIQPRRRAAE